MTPQATLWITTGIFILTYLGLALGRLPGLRMDRAGIAFAGAAAMLATGLLTLAQATSPESIDYQTLFLLFGMMIVVGCLRLSGFFAQTISLSLSRIRTPRGLLFAIIVLSGLLSAFLVNDIVCLALTPLVLHLTRRLRFDPMPHLIGLATAANIGSVGTITGNPQNMMIGVQSGISYFDFAARLLPIAAVGLVVDFLVVAWVYRKTLRAPAGRAGGGYQDGGQAIEEDIPNRRVHRWLRRKSVTVALLTFILFFAGLPIAIVALAAAAVLLIDRIKPERIYQQVDWSLLLMFIGLFIVVHAFQMNVVTHWEIDRWNFLLANPVGVLSLVSAGLSNLVSNVPAVLLLEPAVQAVPQALRQDAWLALAMSSTFAGNLTILGSIANLIVVESARREGFHISFREYCKAGVPVTLLILGLGIAWLKWVVY